MMDMVREEVKVTLLLRGVSNQRVEIQCEVQTLEFKFWGLKRVSLLNLPRTQPDDPAGAKASRHRR